MTQTFAADFHPRRIHELWLLTARLLLSGLPRLTLLRRLSRLCRGCLFLSRGLFLRGRCRGLLLRLLGERRSGHE